MNLGLAAIFVAYLVWRAHRSTRRNAPVLPRWEGDLNAQTVVRALVLLGQVFVVWVALTAAGDQQTREIFLAAAVLATPFTVPGPTVAVLVRVLPPGGASMAVDLLGPLWSASDGGAAGVIAVARARRLSPAQVGALRVQLEGPRRLRPLRLVAHASLHAALGERDEARRVMRCVARLGAVRSVEPARAMARAWLHADAFARGDVHDILELATLAPTSAADRSLSVGLVRVAQGEPFPLGVLLVHGLRSWDPVRVVRLALAETPDLCRDEALPRLTGLAGVALARAATARARAEPTLRTVEYAARAWQQVRDDADLAAAWRARAQAVGVGVDPVGDELAAARATLAGLLVEMDRYPTDGPPILVEAADVAVEQALALLEESVEDLEALKGGLPPATEDHRSLERLDEAMNASGPPPGAPPREVEAFRRWERVRHRATSLTRDRPELHLQLVEVVVARVLTAAARSYNRHGERGFPEAAFRWLLDWAGPLVRPELHDLLWNNLRLTWR